MSETLLSRTPSRLKDWFARRASASTIPENSDVAPIAYDCDLVPPAKLMRTEGIGVLEEWFRWAEEWSMCLRIYGGLRSTSDVLEIGCGLGRIAFPLRFLIRDGSYRGFDISRQKIEFLEERFQPAFGNFRFEYADVRNTEYNPTGRIPGSAFTFPYRDNSFDIVYAASVFTHMLPETTAHYFQEASRVLRDSGCFVASFFVYDFYKAGRVRAPAFNNPRFDFDHSLEKYGSEFAFVDPANLELMTAYRISLIEKMAGEAGLELSRDPVAGLWSGTQDAPVGAQDLIVLKKSASTGNKPIHN